MAGRKTTRPGRGRQKAAEPPVVAHDAAAASVAQRVDEKLAESHRISRRAYELFLARGGEHGRDVDDWLEAERQVRKGSGRLSSGGTSLSVDDQARGELRRKQYEEGASLVTEID